MQKALVTVSTDGLRDYVTLPDGQRLTLGTVSVLRFVTELTPHIRLARQIIEQFIKTGEALFTIDLDKMGDLLTSRRSRWSASPLIDRSDRTSTERLKMADNLLTRLGLLEETVTKLDKIASASDGEVLVASKLHTELQKLACGLVEPEATVEASEPAAPAAPVASAPVATPSVDALQANATLADEVLTTVEQTSERIDQLVTAGRKFNASKARADLFVIANKVAEILDGVDLAQPWVQKDLAQLADDANKIHALFAPAKV